MPWAIIEDETGEVVNVIAWDGSSPIALPEGHSLVSVPKGVSPGDLWDGTTVTPVVSDEDRDRQNRDIIRTFLGGRIATLRQIREGTDGLTAAQRDRLLADVLLRLVRDALGQLEAPD